MALSSFTDAIEIEVDNFGPIAKAKLDLRPLTVFIGPSNSGKSYLSILIYALHCAFGKQYDELYQNLNVHQPLPEERVYELQNWFGENFYKPRKNLSTDRNFIPEWESYEIPKQISQLVEKNICLNSHIGTAFKDQVTRCFGAQIRTLIRRTGFKQAGIFDKASVKLKRNAKDHKNFTKSFMYSFELNDGNSKWSLENPEEVPFCISASENDAGVANLRVHLLHDDLFDDKNDVARQCWIIGKRLTNAVFSNSIGPFGRRAHYLPADRTGIMHAHRTMVSASIERATQTGIRHFADLPVLSGVVADFLGQLVTINDGSLASTWDGSFADAGRKHFRATTPHRDLHLIREAADRLEKEILGGEVYSTSFGGLPTSYPDFSFKPKGWSDSLPLMLASSMISELSSVVLYLRRVAAPGDVLIIEEPEGHLHPKLQVKFVKLLAEVAKSGIRIILTTHSSLVLATVANLVFLEDIDKQNGNNSENMLSRQDVGLWSFVPKNRPKGTVVEEIAFDPHAGGFPARLDDAAMDLHNEWASIHNAISERDE